MERQAEIAKNNIHQNVVSFAASIRLQVEPYESLVRALLEPYQSLIRALLEPLVRGIFLPAGRPNNTGIKYFI